MRDSEDKLQIFYEKIEEKEKGRERLLNYSRRGIDNGYEIFGDGDF